MHQDCRIIITGRLSKTDKTFCIYPAIRVYILIDQYRLLKFNVLGDVYMTLGRLSPKSEFTPVPSHGSIFYFVYMIPPQNVMPARVTRA